MWKQKQFLRNHRPVVHFQNILTAIAEREVCQFPVTISTFTFEAYKLMGRNCRPVRSTRHHEVRSELIERVLVDFLLDLYNEMGFVSFSNHNDTCTLFCPPHLRRELNLDPILRITILMDQGEDQ